jgi:hypothetical protein
MPGSALRENVSDVLSYTIDGASKRRRAFVSSLNWFTNVYVLAVAENACENVILLYVTARTVVWVDPPPTGGIPTPYTIAPGEIVPVMVPVKITGVPAVTPPRGSVTVPVVNGYDVNVYVFPPVAVHPPALNVIVFAVRAVTIGMYAVGMPVPPVNIDPIVTVPGTEPGVYATAVPAVIAPVLVITICPAVPYVSNEYVLAAPEGVVKDVLSVTVDAAAL